MLTSCSITPISVEFKFIEPLSGFIRPNRINIKVDLPAPFNLARPTISFYID